MTQSITRNAPKNEATDLYSARGDIIMRHFEIKSSHLDEVMESLNYRWHRMNSTPFGGAVCGNLNEA